MCKIPRGFPLTAALQVCPGQLVCVWLLLTQTPEASQALLSNYFPSCIIQSAFKDCAEFPGKSPGKSPFMLLSMTSIIIFTGYNVMFWQLSCEYLFVDIFRTLLPTHQVEYCNISVRKRYIAYTVTKVNQKITIIY